MCLFIKQKTSIRKACICVSKCIFSKSLAIASSIIYVGVSISYTVVILMILFCYSTKTSSTKLHKYKQHCHWLLIFVSKKSISNQITLYVFVVDVLYFFIRSFFFCFFLELYKSLLYLSHVIRRSVEPLHDCLVQCFCRWRHVSRSGWNVSFLFWRKQIFPPSSIPVQLQKTRWGIRQSHLFGQLYLLKFNKKIFNTIELYIIFGYFDLLIPR